MSICPMYDKAMVYMVKNRKFAIWTSIILNHEPVADTNIPIAGIDGRRLYINPETFDKLTLGEAQAVLMHEAEHILRLHHFRRGDRDPMLWNFAGDAIINRSVDNCGIDGVSLPADVFRFDKGETEEQVYNLLPKNPNGGCMGQDMKGDGNTGQNPAITEAQAKRMVSRAVEHARQLGGNVPGGMEELVDSFNDSRVDYKERLYRFLTDTKKTDYSFQKPNRRFVTSGLYLPSMMTDGAIKDLAIVIDTSGSCWDDAPQYFGEICKAILDVNPGRIHVIYCDCAVNHVDVFDQPTDAEIRSSAKKVGGGGTDMTIALDWIDKEIQNPTAVLVFTDGYTPFGPARSYPTLWMINTEVSSPWGETVQIEKLQH